VLAALSALTVAPAAAAASTGSTTVETYDSATGPVHYRIYTPRSYRADKRVPLVVFTHGCNTTAEQQQRASLYDDVADEHGFVVAYPDNDDQAHPVKCWRFYDPQNSHRDQADLATIAGITRATMTKRTIDAQRVYEVAMSSGALITSDLGAAYPDLYAAIGIMAGGPYGTPVTCLGDLSGVNTGTDPVTLGQEAATEMGSRARVMPFIVLNGDSDHTVAPQCDEDAVTQWVTTDDLVTAGAPFATTPIAKRTVTPRAARSYDVLTYGDRAGCVVGEHWIVHGMDHYWSGGTTDPAYKAFVDPTGPSAAEATWAFFSRFTLASHEACPAAARPRRAGSA
jgi:poly(hydroxyalkanoate) depolymerase family esterase